MPLTHAYNVISRLNGASVPQPTRKEIQKAYEDIFARTGEHSEPLRTHIFGVNALGAGQMLGSLLSQYLLNAELPAAARDLPSKKPRRF